MDVLKRANKWAVKHPVEFAAIQMTIGAIMHMVMGGHPTKSTIYVKDQIDKISREHHVPKTYVEVWVKQELNKKSIRYVRLG
ncbi:MAG: hypothetical protein COT21_03195 [Hadesarchaea archaeon CG08_land_8_20_14_0_20_51_8]|jgi:hypothetical protein|nr:MAG: hypothetical protein COT21_03195 [Hadesarchaea archaeon CG08_land_8_20_14_0_20_51_8]